MSSTPLAMQTPVTTPLNRTVNRAANGATNAAANGAVDLALARAQACLAQGAGAQAVQLLQSAARAAPKNAAVLTGLGVALRFMGDLEAAATALLAALAVAPTQADAQVYLGMIRLAQGRQNEGWALYQARWRHGHWTEPLRYPADKVWRGHVRPAMRLLVWGEQGFGDTLQFARYAPWLWRLLGQQGGRLVLEVAPPLRRLLQASWPFMEVCNTHEVRGHFDAHVPLMDLPHLWGNLVGDGGLPYLPMPLPYVSALPDLLGAAGRVNPRVLRVGLAWQGRPSHPDDRQRSIAVQALSTLFAVPGVAWVSLQKGDLLHPDWLPQAVAGCQDFADTARVVGGLDLVISIDSAIAHLAGALGQAVWVLLPQVADWRWQLAGEHTPWYPTMRLFRQRARGDWGPVIDQVAQALASCVAARSAAPREPPLPKPLKNRPQLIGQ